MTPREHLTSLFAAWEHGDALRAAAHFAADGSYSEAGRPATQGRDAIASHFTRFFRDGPAWRFMVDTVLVEGERAAVAYRFALEGAPGTWRERAGCAMVRFAEGAITEWQEYEA